MITVLCSDKPIAVNELGQKVLGSGYFIGKLKPNYPMPVTISVAATMLFADQGEYDLAAMYQLDNYR